MVLAEARRRAGHGAVLDARPHGGPRPRVQLGGAQAEGRVQQAHRQHQGGRHGHGEHGQLRSVAPGRSRPRATASSRPRAARCATGSTSRTRRSRTTSASCRPPGTRARVTRPARSARTRLRCSIRRCTIPSSRSRSCARSTASIRAWRARRTCSTWTATRSRASRSGKEGCHEQNVSPFDAARGRVREGHFGEAILPPAGVQPGPVYVYDAAIRIWHWVTMLAIIVLCVTGYFIGSPLPSHRRRGATTRTCSAGSASRTSRRG